MSYKAIILAFTTGNFRLKGGNTRQRGELRFRLPVNVRGSQKRVCLSSLMSYLGNRQGGIIRQIS